MKDTTLFFWLGYFGGGFFGVLCWELTKYLIGSK